MASAVTDRQTATSDDIIQRLGTAPVPAHPYYRRDYYELEVEAIFKRTWLQVGHVCELPEPETFMVRQVDVANASILITRGPDSVIRAFHNVCTHRGSKLVADENGTRRSFSCPYHMWTFGYDGSLRTAPDFKRFYVEQSQCNLKPVAVDVCAGLIFINLDPAPEVKLRDFLGPVADKLETLVVARATTFSEYVYEIAGNWKLIMDNFQENYHLRFVHPRSGGGTRPENPFGYPVRFGFMGPHRTQTFAPSDGAVTPTRVQAFGFGKAAEFAAVDGLLGGEFARDYFAIFPNFFMQGSGVAPFSHHVMPLGPEKSLGVFRLYWIGEDDSATRRFAREYVTMGMREIHSEDRVSIENSQAGLSSGALEHIHFQENEVLCRHLFHEVNSRVEAYQAAMGGARA